MEAVAELEYNTKESLISIIKSLDNDLKEARKEVRLLRRGISRTKKQLGHIKVKYDEISDIYEEENDPNHKIPKNKNIVNFTMFAQNANR